MAKKFLTPIGLVSLPSDPADGIEGQLYFNTTSDIIKVYANGSWAVLQGGGSNQDTINTASAAAFNSASANTVSQINALTTSDIEEGSRLYYTNTRGLTTASTALVHGNHTNITASYNSASNQIILVGTGGGGAGGDGASVIYSTEQPDINQLTIGDIWIDSNASVSNGIVNPHGFGYITTTPATQTIQSDTDYDGVNFNAGTSITLNAASATNTLTISSTITNLNSLTDTTITSPSNNQLLAYNSSSTQWTNQDVMSILSTANASATYLTVTAASATYEPNITYNTSSPAYQIATGQLWIDTTEAEAPILKVYNGSTWIEMSGAGGGGDIFDTLLLMGV